MPCLDASPIKNHQQEKKTQNESARDKNTKGSKELGKKRTLKWANSISVLHTLTRIFHQAIGHSLDLFIFRTTSSSHKRTNSQHLCLKHVVRKAVRLERKKEKGVLLYRLRIFGRQIKQTGTHICHNYITISQFYLECFRFVWRIDTRSGELATSVRRKFGQLSKEEKE